MDVLAALRASTAQQHAELDQATPLAQAEADLQAYRDHLTLLSTWLAPIQTWLGQFDAPPKLRGNYLELMRQDLADPLLSICTHADSRLPAGTLADPLLPAGMPVPAGNGHEATWPADAHAAYRWGVCYVVEGSQLGGAVLYKRLAQRLAPHPLRYLRGDASPGPRWQQFIAGLRAAVTSEAQIADACLGAKHAFDTLIALNRLNTLNTLSSAECKT